MASGRESGRGGIGILSLISALALIALLFTLAFSRSGDSSPDSKTSADLATQKKSGRLAAYCYEERSRGAEGGHSSIPPSWKLVHAVVNLRHGDRTSIHNLGERLVSLSLTLSLLYISPSLPLSVSVCLSCSKDLCSDGSGCFCDSGPVSIPRRSGDHRFLSTQTFGAQTMATSNSKAPSPIERFESVEDLIRDPGQVQSTTCSPCE
jgi:hypothetical protein